LSVTEISVATQRPGRVVGMHFFNPAPVQEFVEVIKTVVTEPHVVEDVLELARRLDKVPVVAADRAGFIANALLFGYLNHAVSMVTRTTPPARTSTPRCDSAAAIRWARWRCST